MSSFEGAESLIAYGAGAFLFGYGVMRIRSSMDPEGFVVEGEASESLSKAMGAVLAFTLLNPCLLRHTVPDRGRFDWFLRG